MYRAMTPRWKRHAAKMCPQKYPVRPDLEEMNPLEACRVHSHFALDIGGRMTRYPLGYSQPPLMPFQWLGNLLACLGATHRAEGGRAAGEGNEGDSMVPCVLDDEEVDTYTAAGYPLGLRGDDVDLAPGEDTGILQHSASVGIPGALEDEAGTLELVVVDDAMRWLDYRARWATGMEARVADSAACPSIASSEPVAMPLELISTKEK
jgi:hypothetical protein